MKEDIQVYLKGRDAPVVIKNGKYLGHKRPDGIVTKNWHYYQDGSGRQYHFRKKEMQLVISNAPK